MHQSEWALGQNFRLKHFITELQLFVWAKLSKIKIANFFKSAARILTTGFTKVTFCPQSHCSCMLKSWNILKISQRWKRTCWQLSTSVVVCKTTICTQYRRRFSFHQPIIIPWCDYDVCVKFNVWTTSPAKSLKLKPPSGCDLKWPQTPLWRNVSIDFYARAQALHTLEFCRRVFVMSQTPYLRMNETTGKSLNLSWTRGIATLSAIVTSQGV